MISWHRRNNVVWDRSTCITYFGVTGRNPLLGLPPCRRLRDAGVSLLGSLGIAIELLDIAFGVFEHIIIKLGMFEHRVWGR